MVIPLGFLGSIATGGLLIAGAYRSALSWRRRRHRAAAGVARNRHPFRSAFMAMGDSTHKLPVKADLRRAIGRTAGDIVTIRLDERLRP